MKLNDLDHAISLTPLYADLLSAIAPSPTWGDHPLFLRWLGCRHSLSDAEYLRLFDYLQRCFKRAIALKVEGALCRVR